MSKDNDFFEYKFPLSSLFSQFFERSKAVITSFHKPLKFPCTNDPLVFTGSHFKLTSLPIAHPTFSTPSEKMMIVNRAPLALLFVAVASFLVKPCFANGVRGGNSLSETFRLNGTSTAAAEWNRHLSSSRSISCINKVDRMKIVDEEEVSPTVTIVSVKSAV